MRSAWTVSPTRRAAPPVAAALLALCLAACAAPQGGRVEDIAAPAAPAPESERSPAPTGAPDASPPNPSPAVPAATSTPELVEACLAFVRDGADAAAEQLDRSSVLHDQARAALRPDGLWYVTVPIDDELVDEDIEYACLLTADLDLDATWGRVAPVIDDFDRWATATEPDGGL